VKRPLSCIVLLAMLLALAGCRSASVAHAPHTGIAPGTPVGTIDFTALHNAERQLLDFALERPTSNELLTAAWRGAVAEAARQGIGDGSAPPPVFTGQATTDNELFDQSFAALRTTRWTQPDATALNGAAITSMATSLHDSHTSYYPPSLFARVNAELDGRPVTMTGMRLLQEERGQVLVVEVLPGSPAEHAGILPGDSIVAIDGKEIGTLDIRQLNRLANDGEPGSMLRVDIRRPGYARVRTFTIVRRPVPLDTFGSAILPGDVGYMRLRVFAGDTALLSEVRAVLQRFAAMKSRGIIIDLRGDPGGSLQTLVAILSRFVAQSPLLIEQRTGRDTAVPRAFNVSTVQMPFVVLVDAGSASSSEIFAAAVKDYRDGLVIGTPTCGCAVGAIFFPLGDGMGGIEVGVARVLSPVTKTNHEGNPVRPDIIVQPDPSALRDGRDPQLERALEALGVPADVARIAAPVARDAQ
jgi:carboxyl-terminal processing protease